MANNWVDFKAVKDAVTFEMVLEHFQINGLPTDAIATKASVALRQLMKNRHMSHNTS